MVDLAKRNRSAAGITVRNDRFFKPLKVEVSNFLRAQCEKLRETPLANELHLLRSAKFDGIITTNYDTILENVFPDYKVYSSQDDTLFQVSHGVGEIFKIHGCATRPNTLVLTEQDYRAFSDKNAYLAAKLTTLFLEHPFVFLGYSISDPNIRSILQAVTACLPASNLSFFRIG
ncbi:SIR2 family NAD-dependent protein deacylase [Nannocystis pusilla]|uniref:SIR2 family NAD-dependent protein deacylase n=1 Tax=Nannocystis pusilla TaxID=889268 RepID=UPI003B82D047